MINPMNFTANGTRVACHLIFFVVVSILPAATCHGNTSNFNPVQLLYSNNESIQLISVDLTKSPNETRVNFSNIIGSLQVPSVIDFSYKFKLVFWIESDQIYGIRVNSPYRIVAKHDLESPSGLAYDWITDKIYWADSVLKRIQVTEKRGKIKLNKVLYWKNLDQPEDIAIVPQKGLIFWSDVGKSPKIESSSMDGNKSTRKIIVNQRISKPVSLTVDYDSDTIYWFDVDLKQLESTTFDGHNRVTLFQKAKEPPLAVAFTVNGDHLFIADRNNCSVFMCNKYDCKSTIQPLFSDPRGPSDIRVFSKRSQPQFNSPCSIKNGGCSDLCLLSSTNALNYSCACPTGIKLFEDGKTCAPSIFEMLILSSLEGLRLVSLDTPDPVDTSIPLKRTQEPLALDFDSTDGLVYWALEQAIMRGKLGDGKSHAEEIVKGINYLEGIAVDWIAKNIYWIDAAIETLEVARTDGSHRRKLIHGLGSNATALVIHPWRGYIFWTNCGDKAKIERAALDGSMRTVIVEVAIRTPRHLTIDLENNQLYWYDLHFHLIKSSDLDGRFQKDLVKVPFAYGLTLLGNWVYWSEVKSMEVFIHKTNKLFGKKVETVTHGLPFIMAMKGVANDTSYYIKENTCNINNGNCTQLCFYMPQSINSWPEKRHICSCSDGFKLAPDGFSCQIDPEYSPSVTELCRVKHCSHDCKLEKHGKVACYCPPNYILSSSDHRTCMRNSICKMNQFQCHNLECVPISSYCDGHYNCTDGSDEENCCQEEEFRCPETNKSKCLSAKKICDGIRDCKDGWDEMCCTSTRVSCNLTNPYSFLNRCILPSQLCDGNPDCDDGSDEDPSKCPSTSSPSTFSSYPVTNYSVAFFLSLAFVAILVVTLVFNAIKWTNENISSVINSKQLFESTEHQLDFSDVHPVSKMRNSDSAPELGRIDSYPAELRRVSGTSLISFSSGSEPYDRSDITGTSSKGSQCTYSLLPQENDPPPSLVTSIQSVYGMSSASGYNMAQYDQYNRRPYRVPPPTPCSNYYDDGTNNYPPQCCHHEHHYEQIASTYPSHQTIRNDSIESSFFKRSHC